MKLSNKVLGLALTTIVCFLTTNPIPTLTAVLVLYIIYKILYFKTEPPIIFAGVTFQWITITLKVFYADAYGIDFYTIHEFPEKIFEVYYMSLVSLIVFSIGVKIALKSRVHDADQKLLSMVKDYNPFRVIILYVCITLAVGSLRAFLFAIPWLTQLMAMVTIVKWGFFYLMFITVHKNPKYLPVLICIILYEFILGFASYFSSFKEVLIFTFIAFIAYHKNIKMKYVAFLLPFIIFIIHIGIVWSAVKGEYRMYLSGGERKQIVTVDESEALSEFINLYNNLDDRKYWQASYFLVDRISYIDFFSAAANYVPYTMPHQNGDVWGEALLHIVTPRFFFPNKPPIDSSKQLNMYTGLTMATAEDGASFSLGYMGDSYVDFGFRFMIIPIFLLGWVIGTVYKYILGNSINVVWGIVLIVPMYYNFQINGTPGIKVLGNLFNYLILCILFKYSLLPYLNKWLLFKNP